LEAIRALRTKLMQETLQVEHLYHTGTERTHWQVFSYYGYDQRFTLIAHQRTSRLAGDYTDVRFK
jgi:hypothetical protein